MRATVAELAGAAERLQELAQRIAAAEECERVLQDWNSSWSRARVELLERLQQQECAAARAATAATEAEEAQEKMREELEEERRRREEAERVKMALQRGWEAERGVLQDGVEREVRKRKEAEEAQEKMREALEEERRRREEAEEKGAAAAATAATAASQCTAATAATEAKEAQATAAAAEWRGARLELEAANARLAAEFEARSLEISNLALEKTRLVKEHALQMQELQAAMEANDQKLGALRREIGEQEERHRRLMCEKDGALAAKDRELGEACCEAGEKGRALAKASEDGAEAKTCLEVTQRSLMELQTKHTLLTFELDASRGNAKELTAGLHALRERMAMMEEHTEEHNNSMLKSLGEAETRLSGSKNANMENEIYIKELQRSLMELETKHTLLTFERDTLRGDATELTAEVDDLRHVAACLTDKLAASEKQLSDEQERLLAYADVCWRMLTYADIC
jgi:hypothetical protein